LSVSSLERILAGIDFGLFQQLGEGLKACGQDFLWLEVLAMEEVIIKNARIVAG
jgi:hypothetical protein